MDREKVINGLEDIQKHLDTGYSFAISWNSELIRDALALLQEQEYKDKMYRALESDWKQLKELLKEQEAVVHPEPSCEMTYITDCCCDLCGVQLIREDNFCRCCGKRIEWESR